MPEEISTQPFLRYQKRQKKTSLIRAKAAGFKEIKFVGSLVCNIETKNAFLIPDPLIHNPLICNPQRPQGKKGKSTAVPTVSLRLLGHGLQRKLTSCTIPPFTKYTVACFLLCLEGVMNNKTSIALVRINELWMFCEVPG